MFTRRTGKLTQIAVNSRQLLSHMYIAGIHTCKAVFQTANCYRRCEYGQTKRNRVQSIFLEKKKKDVCQKSDDLWRKKKRRGTKTMKRPFSTRTLLISVNLSNIRGLITKSLMRFEVTVLTTNLTSCQPEN
jgi:hypothetical protein